MKALLAIDTMVSAQEIIKFLSGHHWLAEAEILLLSVIPPIDMVAPMMPLPIYSEAVYKDMHDSTQGVLTKTVKELNKNGYTNVSADVKLGDPAFTIIDYAKEWKADILVMCTHSRHGLSKFWYGSVSEDVTAKAPCSVIVLRLGTPEAAAST